MKIHRYHAKVLFPIILMALIITLGCGGSDRNQSSSPDVSVGSIIFSLAWKDAPLAQSPRRASEDDICESYGIDTITAAIMDRNDIELVSGRWQCDAHAGTLNNIPANRGPLVLIVEALVSGARLWRGEVNDIQIIPGQNVDVGPIDMENIGAANIMPTADAGPDQSVGEGTMVKLSGINSIDGDDGIASFQWYQTDGPEVVFSTPDEPETWFLAPEVDNCGAKLAFELAVTDYAEATSVDDCIVNVTSENQNEPPNADAGTDQTVNDSKDIVNLDASNSTDPDDNIESYEWKLLNDGGPTVILSDYYSPAPSFQPPDVGPEGATMTFEVIVTDDCGLQDTATCIINITWNTPPFAIANVDPEIVVSGNQVTLDGEQSWDEEDAFITAFQWKQTKGVPVKLSDSTAQTTTFRAPDVNEDTLLEFKLTVSDSDDKSGADTCQVSVAADDVAPTVTITEPSSELLYYTKKEITLTGTASDNVDVDRVVWQNSATEKTGVAVGTADWSIEDIELKRGYNLITVTAYDYSGNQMSASRIIFRR